MGEKIKGGGFKKGGGGGALKRGVFTPFPPLAKILENVCTFFMVAPVLLKMHDNCFLLSLSHPLPSPKSQTTTEKRMCAPPETPAPALPETEDPPDVVPHTVYDDLNTLSRKVFYFAI